MRAQVMVRAKAPMGPSPCPCAVCRWGQVHGYHWRTMADVQVDGMRAVFRVRVRRLVCPTRGCRRTFREQARSVGALSAAHYPPGQAG